MDFRKKLKIRLWVAITYIILGVIMIVTFNLINTDNNFLSSWGFALIVIGIVRIRNYPMITKDEETVRKQQIAESDERNIAIANKAKSVAFTVYLLLACVAVIVLQLMNKTELALSISYPVLVLILIYWISYWIIRKKS